MKDRIGTLENLPLLTIGGNSYTRPCSTLSLGYGLYAVLDTFGNTEDEISKLRASIKPVSKKKITTVSEGT